jgi:uncharacterized membrane protein required for colicin V production
MNKILGMLLIALSAFMLIVCMWALISHSVRNPQTQKEWVKNQLITIEVDGKEYLYGDFNKNVVIIPKTTKCSCDTIR